jgi:hypothetical protein
MDLTYNNYLYGTGSGNTWHVNIDPPAGPVKSYFEETLTSIEYVYANKTGKIHLMYSGGLDSEFVARILLHLKMDFEVVIIRLTNPGHNDYNDYDTKYAFEFCKSHNITPIVYELDFMKLVESGKHRELAESVECCAVAVATTLYVTQQIDGFTLMGNDPPYIRYEKDKDAWYLEELQYIHSLLRYYKKFNLQGCPFLLSYRPEQMLSFLLDPAIQELGFNKLPGKTGSNSTKSYAFNRGNDFNMDVYDFVNKTRIKVTGHEKIYRDCMDHPNLAVFKNEFKEKWNGEYLEYFPDVVKRLSINLDKFDN